MKNGNMRDGGRWVRGLVLPFSRKKNQKTFLKRKNERISSLKSNNNHNNNDNNNYTNMW